MTAYWTAFREGIDDARYVYTLEDAIVRRAPGASPELRAELERRRELLRGLWNAILVRSKYLGDDGWAAADFDANRFKLAEQIERLRKFQETADAVAPSVLPEVSGGTEKPPAGGAGLEIAGASAEVFDLIDGAHAENWRSDAGELTLERRPGALRMKIKVDYSFDGERSRGAYKIGWPRMRFKFADGKFDLGAYDFLQLEMNISSNRHEEAKQNTPIYFSVHSASGGYKHDYYVVNESSEDRPVTVLFPVEKFIATSPAGALRTVEAVQLGIKEREFHDGDELTFDLRRFRLLKLTSPLMQSVETPADLLLPAGSLPFKARILAPDKLPAELTVRNTPGRQNQ